jgi:hypothetical protein
MCVYRPLNTWRSEAPPKLGTFLEQDGGGGGGRGGGGAGASSVYFPQVEERLVAPALLVESWAPGQTVQTLFSEVGDGGICMYVCFSADFTSTYHFTTALY